MRETSHCSYEELALLLPGTPNGAFAVTEEIEDALSSIILSLLESFSHRAHRRPQILNQTISLSYLHAHSGVVLPQLVIGLPWP